MREGMSLAGELICFTGTLSMKRAECTAAAEAAAAVGIGAEVTTILPHSLGTVLYFFVICSTPLSPGPTCLSVCWSIVALPSSRLMLRKFAWNNIP